MNGIRRKIFVDHIYDNEFHFECRSALFNILQQNQVITLLNLDISFLLLLGCVEISIVLSFWHPLDEFFFIEVHVFIIFGLPSILQVDIVGLLYVLYILSELLLVQFQCVFGCGLLRFVLSNAVNHQKNQTRNQHNQRHQFQNLYDLLIDLHSQ